tara:strand:+ start:20957 stop:22324 length:1368 start_codon:yes stop_codon:yes gene_type:complete
MIKVRFGLLFIAIIAVLIGHWILGAAPEQPRKDSVRYADYIFNLHTFQVFGLSYGKTETAPLPGAANAPLYPSLVSLFVTDKTNRSLACTLASTPRFDCQSPGTSCGPINVLNSCEPSLEPLILFNYALLALSLFLCGWLAFSLTGSYLFLYFTPLFAFLSFQLTDYGQRLLVANLVIPLFLSLQLILLAFIKQPGLKLSSAAGILTGLLTLTRPEYLYMAPVVAGCFWWLSKKPIYPAILLIAFAMTLTPWIWRNHSHFDQTTLIQSNYGNHIATERIALNQMSWTQWPVSFIYWFPDSGDKIAKFLFRKEVSGAFDNSSAYSIFAAPNSELFESIDPTRSPLMILADGFVKEPLKHIAVTLSLAWRGVFVGKIWGAVGLIGYLLLLYRETSRGRYGLMWISVLPLFMLAMRAGVSLNVPRYNAPMIGLLAMGWVYFLGALSRSSIQHDLHTDD